MVQNQQTDGMISKLSRSWPKNALIGISNCLWKELTKIFFDISLMKFLYWPLLLEIPDMIIKIKSGY